MGNSGKIDHLSISKLNELRKKGSQSETRKNKDGDLFNSILNKNISESRSKGVKHGVKLSSHAMKRVQERNLNMDGEEFFKIKGAINKLKSKGGKDSLIVTDKAAYIVDVDKQMVVTAMDKDNMAENVFTKIDSTMFLN